MRLVILESPLAGDTERNVAYACAAMRDALERGEAPMASHILYGQALSDSVAAERIMGIEAGLAWGRVAEATVVYEDFGVSPGMQQGITRALAEGRPVEYRKLWGDDGTTE
jgi:hypothetical protein